MIDRRIALAAVLVVGFGGGWLARTLVPKGLPYGMKELPPGQTWPAPAAKPTEQAFVDIYNDATWGKNERGAASSGTGSTRSSTLLYRTYLEKFLERNHITSVVDAGCGDWEFSSAIDWTGIDYKGYDIVDDVVKHDTEKYGKPNIHFFHANVVDADLPPADLLIAKHVLQHLPNADVKKFLDTQLKKYKFALITDSVNPRTMSGANHDITPGQFRELDPTAPPFSVPGWKVLTYWDGGNMQQVVGLDTGYRAPP